VLPWRARDNVGQSTVPVPARMRSRHTAPGDPHPSQPQAHASLNRDRSPVERPRMQLAQGQGSAIIVQAARAESASRLRQSAIGHRRDRRRHRLRASVLSPTFKKCILRKTEIALVPLQFLDSETQAFINRALHEIRLSQGQFKHSGPRGPGRGAEGRGL
jgi:hypothetical protein